MKFGFQIRADHISSQSPFHPSKNVAVKGTTAHAAVDKKIGQVSQRPDTIRITGDSDDEDQDAMDMGLVSDLEDEFCERYADFLEDQDSSGTSDIEVLDVPAVKEVLVKPVSPGSAAKSQDVVDLTSDSDGDTPAIVRIVEHPVLGPLLGAIRKAHSLPSSSRMGSTAPRVSFKIQDPGNLLAGNPVGLVANVTVEPAATAVLKTTLKATPNAFLKTTLKPTPNASLKTTLKPTPNASRKTTLKAAKFAVSAVPSKNLEAPRQVAGALDVRKQGAAGGALGGVVDDFSHLRVTPSPLESNGSDHPALPLAPARRYRIPRVEILSADFLDRFHF